jgi:hypothetical protein
MTTERNQKCSARIDDSLERTLETLRELWSAYLQEEIDCPRCDGASVTSPQCDACTLDHDSPEIDCNYNDSCPHDEIETVECEKCDGTGFINAGDEDGQHHDGEGSIYEYGLCFDYVAPGTFNDQDEGYFRYQLSWGGPSDEFRIYAQGREYDWSIYRIEYWFLDWYDGASRTLSGDDRDFILELMYNLFVEVGSFESAYNEAME